MKGFFAVFFASSIMPALILLFSLNASADAQVGGPLVAKILSEHAKQQKQEQMQTQVGQKVISLLTTKDDWTVTRQAKTDIAPGYNQLVYSRNKLSIYVDEFGKGSKCNLWLNDGKDGVWLNPYMTKEEVTAVCKYINDKTKAKRVAEILKLLEEGQK